MARIHYTLGGKHRFTDKSAWGTYKVNALNPDLVDVDIKYRNTDGTRGYHRSKGQAYAKYDEYGELVGYGQFVKGSFEHLSDVTYRFDGDDRLHNGFSVLLGEMGANGIPRERLDVIADKWDSLSEVDKRVFYKRYHNSALVKLYGSHATNERALDVESGTYKNTADVIEELLDEIKAGN